MFNCNFWKLRLTLWLAGTAIAQNFAQEPLLPLDNTVSEDCHNACIALTEALGSKAFYKSQPSDFTTSYYTTQQRLTVPACIIRPSTTQEVSSAIKIITQYQCHFAVKSGGHARFSGASNSDGGVTIDLKDINTIEVQSSSMGNVSESATARIGAGQRWGAVYEALESFGLTVVGGREADVGVGGFILGGGISFLSRRYGWASDNVRNYELVLANGSIAQINRATHSDLYWALRGGGCNFGIVTHFDLEAHPTNGVWGGNNIVMFNPKDIAARRLKMGIVRPSGLKPLFQSPKKVITHLGRKVGDSLIGVMCLFGKCISVSSYMIAVESLAKEHYAIDEYSQLYMSVGYEANLGILAGSMFLTHARPVADPPAFGDIKKLNTVYSTNRVANISDFATELVKWNVPGYRHLWKTITIQADAVWLERAMEFFIETSETLIDIPGILPSYVMQPLEHIAAAGSSKNGGNPLGIHPDSGPILMYSISPRWDHEADDEVVHAAFDRFMDRSEALAKEMGLWNRYIYQNYAHADQDVFAGYGEENRKKLLDIQRRYDPDGVYSTLQRGYFKL